MTDDVRAKVVTSVQAEYGWTSEEIEIVDLESLELPPCRFFNVREKDSKDPFGLDYAVLPDGGVTSSAEKDAAGKILDACAGPAPASAGAWAEVLARFHPEVGPGTVLYEAKRASVAVQRLEASGRSFEPPSLSSGQDGVTVHFYLMNYETGRLSAVHALRRPDGTLEVTRGQGI